MGHKGYGHHLAPVGLELLLLAAMIAALVLLAWWLWSRRQAVVAAEDGGPTLSEEEVDAQILAMLHQAGGSLKQTTIRANLHLSLEEVAAGLGRLEERGVVTRVWQVDDYTYGVHTTA